MNDKFKDSKLEVKNVLTSQTEEDEKLPTE